MDSVQDGTRETMSRTSDEKESEAKVCVRVDGEWDVRVCTNEVNALTHNRQTERQTIT